MPKPSRARSKRFRRFLRRKLTKRTKSGKSILLGNPHQPWAALYWEAQVTVPGKLNMFGGTFAGRPLLTTGFNEFLGWTHTVNLPDLDDIYVLQMDREKPHHYIFEGKSMPLTSREITVTVQRPSRKREPAGSRTSVP